MFSTTWRFLELSHFHAGCEWRWHTLQKHAVISFCTSKRDRTSTLLHPACYERLYKSTMASGHNSSTDTESFKVLWKTVLTLFWQEFNVFNQMCAKSLPKTASVTCILPFQWRLWQLLWALLCLYPGIDLVRVSLLQRQAPAVSLCPRTPPVDTQGILVNEVLGVKMKGSSFIWK